MIASLLILLAAHLPIVIGFVNYGDMVYFQVQNHGSRWLTGGRGNKNIYVRLDAHAQSAEAPYRWQIRSNPGSGEVGFADPSAQQCVKYGDIVYLQVQNLGSRWLTGGRDDKSISVYTKNYLESLEQSASTTYRWQIRSSPSTEIASQCVTYGDFVHLKVESLGSGWLKGGEDGNRVHTENHPDGGSVPAYQWQIRSSPRGKERGVSPSSRAQTPSTTTTQTTTSTTQEVLPISEASSPVDTDEGSISNADPATEPDRATESDPATELDPGSAGADDTEGATGAEL
mmetsp:Transcript_2800/g.6033  ORF Transcript_2800/g.6033 Transcript_2800/m.6033 type:complete len:286 (-) Transcript_2800:11-868(-)